MIQHFFLIDLVCAAVFSPVLPSPVSFIALGNPQYAADIGRKSRIQKPQAHYEPCFVRCADQEARMIPFEWRGDACDCGERSVSGEGSDSRVHLRPQG